MQIKEKKHGKHSINSLNFLFLYSIFTTICYDRKSNENISNQTDNQQQTAALIEIKTILARGIFNRFNVDQSKYSLFAFSFAHIHVSFPHYYFRLFQSNRLVLVKDRAFLLGK